MATRTYSLRSSKRTITRVETAASRKGTAEPDVVVVVEHKETSTMRPRKKKQKCDPDDNSSVSLSGSADPSSTEDPDLEEEIDIVGDFDSKPLAEKISIKVDPWLRSIGIVVDSAPDLHPDVQWRYDELPEIVSIATYAECVGEDFTRHVDILADTELFTAYDT